MQSTKQNNIYVILGWARTGSNWIVDIMASRTNKPAGIASAVLCNETTPTGIRQFLHKHPNIVIHSHDRDFLKNLQLDPKEVTLIVSKRRDWFAGLMSYSIAQEISKEWNGYTKRNLVPATINPRLFMLWTVWAYTWYDSLDLSLPYKKVETVFYEDISLYGHKHIMDAAGIDRKTPFIPSEVIGPSPHKYKELVLNWKDLFVLYEKTIALL